MLKSDKSDAQKEPCFLTLFQDPETEPFLVGGGVRGRVNTQSEAYSRCGVMQLL